MTAIVGLFGIDASDSAALARSMLAAMHTRGTERVELWHGEGVALGAVSNAWEVGQEGPDSARVAFDDCAAVATDATLYYVGELREALARAGVSPGTSLAAHVLAAYRAWGDRFLDQIEGDFAVIVWDLRERRLVAARDHSGTRPLFYAMSGSGLALASRLDGLTTLPSFDRAYDMLSIGNDALHLRVQIPEGTAYAAAKRLPAGHRLDWHASAAPRIARWWDVPIFHRGDGPPFAEATEELRRLIVAAVGERTAHPGGAAIWLSGGYDSSSLFAASNIAAERFGAQLAHPVSMSHPPGDAGREDELIEASTGFWHVTPTWVDVDDVPALEFPIDQARLRDEPMYHTYELSNRALAVATRAAGRRAVIVGNGGDQFFSSGVARLADHFRSGRFITLAREWREAGGGRDWRLFVRTAVLPNLPLAVLDVANELRQRRTLQHRPTRQLPAWANREFDQLPELEALNRRGLERRPGEGHAALDQSWSLRHVMGERIIAAYTGTGLLDGIDLRSPLFDARVIRFAARRPLDESYSRLENKRLLRAAFAKYLPNSVMSPRSARTGLPTRSLLRTAIEHAVWAMEECGKGMILAELDVIDGSKFLERAAVLSSRSITDVEEAAAFVACTQAECWLRARS